MFEVVDDSLSALMDDFQLMNVVLKADDESGLIHEVDNGLGEVVKEGMVLSHVLPCSINDDNEDNQLDLYDTDNDDYAADTSRDNTKSEYKSD